MTLSSCTSDKEVGLFISDATLFDLSSQHGSFQYFRLSADTLPTAPASPHLSYIRVRFNEKAVAAMNDSLSSLTTKNFPDESMVVKEVYDIAGGELKLLAIMFKKRSAMNSASGWVWNELKGDGTVVYSAASKGEQCVACHASGINSNLVRTFSLH